MGDFILLEKHWLSSTLQKRAAKFVGPFKVLEVMNNNLVIDVGGERMTFNLDQVRVYRFRADGSKDSQMSSGISQIP